MTLQKIRQSADRSRKALKTTRRRSLLNGLWLTLSGLRPGGGRLAGGILSEAAEVNRVRRTYPAKSSTPDRQIGLPPTR
jgi:hypothetical protein